MLRNYYEDPLEREVDEPIDPRWTKHNVDVLKAGSKRAWFSVYQQNPRTVGGTLIKIDQLIVLEPAAAEEKFPQKFRTYVRGWDLAFSEKHLNKSSPSFTAGAKLALYKKDKEYSILIEDMKRWQRNWPESKRGIVEVAEADGTSVKIVVESGGPQKGLGDELKADRKLAAFSIIQATPVVDKVARANYWTEKAEDGKFYIVNGPWVRAFLDECEVFDNGAHNDQVDAVSIAYWQLSKYLRMNTFRQVKISGLFK